MTKEEKQKLLDDLASEAKTLENQLKEISVERDGYFEANVEDIGSSSDDVAEELASLDQRQAMVNTLQKRYKEVKNAMEKLGNGDTD